MSDEASSSSESSWSSEATADDTVLVTNREWEIQKIRFAPFMMCCLVIEAEYDVEQLVSVVTTKEGEVATGELEIVWTMPPAPATNIPTQRVMSNNIACRWPVPPGKPGFQQLLAACASSTKTINGRLGGGALESAFLEEYPFESASWSSRVIRVPTRTSFDSPWGTRYLVIFSLSFVYQARSHLHFLNSRLESEEEPKQEVYTFADFRKDVFTRSIFLYLLGKHLDIQCPPINLLVLLGAFQGKAWEDLLVRCREALAK